MIIENAIDVLQEKFNTENLLKKERYTRLNNLADAILQNTPQNPDELNSLLREVQMQELDSYQAIAFLPKTPIHNSWKNELLPYFVPCVWNPSSSIS